MDRCLYTTDKTFDKVSVILPKHHSIVFGSILSQKELHIQVEHYSYTISIMALKCESVFILYNIVQLSTSLSSCPEMKSVME